MPVDETGNDFSQGFVLDTPDPSLVFASSSFANADEFFHGYLQAELPFMKDDYKI